MRKKKLNEATGAMMVLLVVCAVLMAILRIYL
jgi:hypothetical protein